MEFEEDSIYYKIKLILEKDDFDKLQNNYFYEPFCEEFLNALESNKTPEELYTEIGEYLIESRVSKSKNEGIEFLAKIFEEYNDLFVKINENSDENENDINFDELDDLKNEKTVDGVCEMCFSNQKITLHHAIPKLMIKR